jgi:hypothetical protein
MEGMRALALFALCLTASCVAANAGATGQGGARLNDARVDMAGTSADALYPVCWPAEAAAPQSVTLTFLDGDVVFEARDGASNSTGRCVREIASSFPFATRPSGAVVVKPPSEPVPGWDVLAWVKLLAPTRFGPERGVLDPAPLVRACLEAGGPVRAATRFEVSHTPSFSVHVPGGALLDAERCIEAVLGSTAWPSTREFVLAFPSSARAPAPAGDVSFYVAAKTSPLGPLDPTAVRESLRLQQAAVGQCWESALRRRAGLGGGRTFRFRTDDTGRPVQVWVTGNVSDAPTAADLLLDQCLSTVLKGAHVEGAGAGDGVYTWIFAARG